MSPNAPLADDPSTRHFLRHALATLAYRAGKVLRDAPPAFGGHRMTPDSPTATAIVAHMANLMEWCLTMADGAPRWAEAEPRPWAAEVERFFAALAALDARFASAEPLRWDPGRLFQGGIADALTHTGQLAMLRRLAGYKMKGENYAKADIAAGRVGIEQTPPDPRVEFE